MNTTGRATQRGGKNTKTEPNTTVKTQKPEVKVDSTKPSPTAEQLRIAQIIGTKNEDPALRNKIKQVMDATRKSEDEVCTALHDCDNDANRAVNYLLEGGNAGQSEWYTSGKKKKNRTASTSKTDAQLNNHVSSGGEGEDWDAPQGAEVSGGTGNRGRTGGGGGGGGGAQDRERPRPRGGGPPRMRGRGSLENRGWRGRENKENERNLEEGGFGGGRRERGGRMSNGPMRSGRGGRGRLGGRTFQSKDKNSNQKFPSTIDTWNNPSTEDATDKIDFPSPEDWDNEEYTGSLADSKVFTPSAGIEPPPPPTEDGENSLATGHLVDSQDQVLTQPPQLSTSPVGDNTLTPAQTQYLSQFSHSSESLKNALNSVGEVGVNTLTPAQSQYLSQLTQSSESFKNALNNGSPSQVASTQAYPTVYTPTSVSCASNFGAPVNIYTSSQEMNSAPSQTNTARSKPQRPRVPPPSKIPSTAVEMPPGDAVNSGIGLLDVQFGGLEFGSSDTTLDNSVDSSTPTPVSATTPASVPTPSVSTPAAMDVYVTNSNQQTTLASALNHQSQKLTSGDSLITSEPVVSSSYGTSNVRSATVVSGTTSTSLSELTSASKTADVSLSYGTVTEPSSIYQSSSAYQKTSTPAYQTPVSTYNSSSYSNTQVTSSTSVYNTSQVGGYASAGSGGGGYTTSVNNAATTPSGNTYPNSNSYSGTHQTTGATYPYPTYPTTGSAGAGYQSTGQTYPPPSAAYGTVYPYHNSYNSNNPPVVSTQQSHKMSGGALSSNTTKDSQYESVPVTNSMAATVSSIAPVTTASATPSLLSGSSQTVAAAASTTKVTSMSTVSKSGVVQNIPPGVPPILGTTQYIMGQTAGGLQYYQQPVFGYDDTAIQVIQPRMPHMVNPSGYFDIGFQPQTSLATGRDGLASVAYSMPADVRFTRSDNNTSPVPSTLSQQSATQAAHQQPLMNPPMTPAYTYAFYGGGMFPGNFQYPLYTPVAPSATGGGHGNSTSAQYAKGYSSAGYGSGYETGSTGDYTAVKVGTGGTSYTPSPAQNKTATGVGTPTGTNPSTTSDLMYNKSHGTLGKVNSYDKQGFHSGTPPPFNSQNTGMAGPNVYGPPLIFPSMPHQQHHSTTIMHQQPMHQMEMRNQGRRTDGGSGSGTRSQTSTQQNKSGAKQNYSPNYWNAN